ncbi:DedA family protein [Pseudomonas syringae]|uniref:DedA family protein n=1 Tax=Pseudomonas syringae TaxID=317 RepID=A0A9Q4A1U1_PSESX|nr:DedA family protein [Pseudomonas syringae]MCF5467596.1 DedA family protein [Pseudomonas syringae]MCF5474075.1 DedA family protein [Pseudomonas syringae]MCF5481195.1 DedA family protein [Pseudomonas syringae]MCF5488333.1 DedA family protein [Pseudomonas syringae]MCF5494306.1 DedA family protein [Pseudomonas syringae]
MLQNFLNEFGYFALFLGTFFEGETILVLAGFLAFRGYMDLNIVIIVAFFGSYAGDQLWYFMGRKHGRKLLARKPRWQLMGDKALRLVRKHPDIWVLGFRFVYGLRTVMPVAIGLSGYPPGRYLLLNGIGAAVWAAALGSAAYHFGAILEGLLGNIKKYELWVLGALILLGLCLWIRRRFKNARIAREAREEKDRYCASAAASDLDEPIAVPVDPAKKSDE